MIFPSLKKVKEINKEDDYRRIPIAYEIMSDIKTPIEVLKILKNNSKHCFMLESVEDMKRWGRYSILGFDPILEITCEDEFLKIKNYSNLNSGLNLNSDSDSNAQSNENFLSENKSLENKSFENKSSESKEIIVKKTKNPRKYIKKIITENKAPNLADLPPFTGGLVGYFAFDYIKYSEPSLNFSADSLENNESFKDVDLMLFDKVIVFDNYKQKMIIIINIKTENIEKEYKKATIELVNLIDLIQNGKPIDETKNRLKLKNDFKPLFSKEKYSQMVNTAKNYIKEGDIFQVVLSNPLSCDMEGSLLDTYRILRTTNPSPYMFYFSSDDMEIAGASPETLVKLHNKNLYTFPLAGTRPRGKDAIEDKQLEKDLLSDEKELAEHNMLVDLGRNDIGKISEFGSVKLEKYLSIEKFSHVMHIGSTVEGKLRDDKDFLDVIDAILPAGTLSGAPKIRACEIIEKLEHNKRGIYGGAIGYISLSGNLDTCIAIRIAFSKNNKVFVRSGAGIVADSVPEIEFEECINKAKAVLNALKLAENI